MEIQYITCIANKEKGNLTFWIKPVKIYTERYCFLFAIHGNNSKRKGIKLMSSGYGVLVYLRTDTHG